MVLVDNEIDIVPITTNHINNYTKYYITSIILTISLQDQFHAKATHLYCNAQPHLAFLLKAKKKNVKFKYNSLSAIYYILQLNLNT